MNVVFRVDSSFQIGNGHVMRCLTLAAALSENGAKCNFICRSFDGNLIEFIRKKGFNVFELPEVIQNIENKDLPAERLPYHANWLGWHWKIDAEHTKKHLKEIRVDWLIVDHYAIDEKWENYVKPICHRLMVIDDLADRNHLCDLLIDQNLGRCLEDYSALINESSKILVGPEFAILRPEFYEWRNKSLERRINGYQFKELLITMGGVDKENFTGKVLNAIKESWFSNSFSITVVMGEKAPWLNNIISLSKTLSQKIEVKINVQNMAEIMSSSDLAIGAGGSTSWERCCLGLPSIVCVIAENQKQIASALEASKAAVIFNINDGFSKVAELIKNFQNNVNELKIMSSIASNITDGHGVKRILSQIEYL